MPLLRPRLSIVVSLLLLGAALLTSALIYLQELRSSREAIRDESLVRLNVLATQLQNVLYTRVSDFNREDALMNLSVAAITPGVRAILLVDGGDHVLLSSHYLWTGEAAGAHTLYDPSAAERVRRSGQSKVSASAADTDLLLGYFPMVLSFKEGGPTTRQGTLYFEFDTGPDMAMARYLAVRHAGSYIALTAASTLLIGLLLHFLIARRVARIAAASDRLAAGDLSVRTRLSGGDEIAQLGQTFDAMVETMGRDAARRKAAEEQARQLAYFDPLTRLPNRRFLADRIGKALMHSEQSQQFGALIMLDLDHFQKLNDAKGHGAGDRLLVEVASRLNLAARTEDAVFRLGGDEFVVVAEGLGLEQPIAAAQAEVFALRIREALSHPFPLGETEYHGTASMGVALFRGVDTSLEILLRQADVALYQAKDAGRNTTRLFNPAAQVAIETHMAMAEALRRALTLGEFRLYFQPQVDRAGACIGAEALVRWVDPARGLVSPAEFIPLAEETGLIVELGCWVIDAACLQLRQWAADPRTRELQMAVNVSARQIRQPDFVERVRRTIEARGVDPRLLKFELTESAVLEDIEGIITHMQELNRIGVNFSLDDFGTGYSSLSYLKRLPLHQVKIDQTFVREVVHNPDDAAIVQAILAMSKSLGLHVIAEGVEKPEQHEFLLRHGCMAFQGYLFGRPAPIDEWELDLAASGGT